MSKLYTCGDCGKHMSEEMIKGYCSCCSEVYCQECKENYDKEGNNNEK